MAPLRAGDPQRIGDYRLIARLGEGGMGTVFLARSDRGRTVAVKLVRGELADQEEFRARFRREVRAAQQVGGEWTAPVLDADTEAETPWVATGYIAGPSLQQVVGRGGTPLPERTVRILAAGLARALQAIHAAGIVHRDLKPSNVLITIDGPRVIDFGIARALEAVTDNGMTRTGATVGSPGFMAPEQVRGKAIGPACDIFSLGSVLMYAATGRQPFGTTETGVHAVMYRIAQEEPDLSALPAGLHDLVAACLAKDPDQRPTPARLLAMAEDAEDAEGCATGTAATAESAAESTARTSAESAADDEPWLPGALIARLGRHAIELLEAENPEGESPATAPHPPLTPPPAPVAPRPPRRRRVGGALVAAVMLVLAGAATTYLLLNKDDGVRVEGKQGQGPDRHAGDGAIPTDYLGTWEAPAGTGAAAYRFTLKQGAPGDTVLTMTATGPTYRCEFRASLVKAGPPVRLGPSIVVSGKPTNCSPGSPSTLEMVDGRLRRAMEGKPPLTYRKKG
ncbi:serine/threonine-protein kinase [Streptomyces chattanoogensis]